MNTCSPPDRSRVQVSGPTLVTETPRIGCIPDAKVADPVVAWSFSEASGHSSRPCASVLGAGGGVLVDFGMALTGAVFTGIGFTWVALTAVGLAGTGFTGVVLPGTGLAGVFLAGVFLAGVLLARVLSAGVAAVVVTVVVTTGFVELSGETELLEDAIDTGGSGRDEREASTPVRLGVADTLPATAEAEDPVEDLFAFWITRNPTPMRTMTAATIKLTRRSQ